MNQSTRTERVLSVLALILGILHAVQSYAYRFNPFNQLWFVEAALLFAVIVCGIICGVSAIRRGEKPHAELLCSVILSLLALLSVLMSLRYDGTVYWVYNRVMILDVLINLLVVFSLPLLLRRVDLGGTALIAAKVLTLAVSAATLLLIIKVFRNQTFVFLGQTLGMRNGRNLEVVFQYNTCGSFFASALAVTILFALMSKKPAQRTLWLVCALPNYLALIMTQSRTSILAFVLIFTILVFILVELCRKPARPLPRFLAAAAAAAVFAALMLISQKIILSALAASWKAMDIQQGVTVRSYAVDNNVTGRFFLWKCSLQAMTYSKHNFLFGTSPNGVIPRINLISNNWCGGGWYTHNQLLEVGVAYGVPAMLVFAVQTVLTIRNSLRVILAPLQDVTPAERFVPLIIAMILAGNVMEALLLAQMTITGVLFFLLSGWLMLRARQLPKVRLQTIRELLA